METTKVRVKRELKSLSHILPLGFETEVVPVRYEKDTVLVNETTKLNKVTGKIEVVNPAVIAYAGSLRKTCFRGTDGELYGDENLMPFSLGEIFDRI